MAYGDIVIIDKTNPLSVTTTNITYHEDVIGVVKTGGANEEMVTIQYAGMIEVNVGTYAVNIGDNIYTGDLYGLAYGTAYGWPGTIAKAITSKPTGATGMVKVLLSGGLPEVY
ncbi:MAG TPA: hypothetical protein VIN73_11815 [Vicingaceae bacterium]